LSRLGRHDEAVLASDEAAELLAKTRTDGVEHVLRWRAEVMTAAGKTEAAQKALSRAAAEVNAKAAKLRDPELKKMYLASRR